MSLRITLDCDGHRDHRRCHSAAVANLGYAPGRPGTDAAAHVAANLGGDTGWRIGALPDGGDLCPSTGHDEDQP